MDKDIQILKARELEVVLKISQAVSRTLDLKEILKMACQMTAQALEADRCSIGLLYTKDVYEIIHTYRKKPSYPSIDGEKFKLADYTHIAQNLLQGKAFHLYDHKKIPLSIKERKLFKQLNLKVFLAVPIIVGKKPLGAFHLGRAEESTPFSSSDINLCQTIASQIGIAIKNATLVKELKEDHQLLEKQSEDLKIRYQQQNLILDISKSLFQSSNLQEVFNIITQKTCEALRLDRCTILQFDSEQKEAVIRSVFHSSGEPSGKGTHDSADLGKRFLVETHPEIYRLLRKKGFLLTEDFQSNPLLPRTRRYIKDLGVKSTLTIPFYSGKKISGSLQLSALKDQHHFSDSEIKFCQTIANLASMAIQNVKLMQDLQEKSTSLQQQTNVLEKQYREQNILLEISKALSQTLDLNTLLDTVTQKGAELLSVDRCALMLLDENTGVSFFYKIYMNGKHRREYENIQVSTSQFPDLFRLLKKQHIFIASNISHSHLSPKEKREYVKAGVKSILVVPFYLSGNVMGLLTLGTINGYHEFTESEVKLGQAIASQLAVVLENAQLLKDLREKNLRIEQQSGILERQFKEQAILLEISKALSQTLELKKLFEIVTKKTTELLSIDRCAAMLIDEIKGGLFLYTVYSNRKHLPENKGVQGNIKDFPVIVSQSKKKHIFLTSDISKSILSSREKKIFMEGGIRSLLVIPFILEGKILGIFALSTTKEKHQFTESEIKLSQAIANQLSVAVENTKLMRDLQEKSLKIQEQGRALEKQLNDQAILLEISKALSQTLDMKELFKIVTQKTVELLGIDRVAAMIIDQKTGDFPLFTHFSRVKQPPELKIFPKSVRDFPDIINQVRNGQIFCVSDVAKSSLTSKEKNYFRKRGIKSVLSVPFILRGRLLGVLALNSIREKHEFTEPEIKLSRAIANLLSVAVENANLMEVSKKHSEELEKLSLQTINAQEEERKNLAGKLHDVIAQDLSALQLDLKMSQQELPEQCAQTRNRLKEGEGLARQALENVRNLTMDLRPPILDDFGLASAIRWYVDSFSRRTNVKVALKLQERDCKLPPEFETAIYRAIQECLTNVAKHSEASKVNVSLDKKNDYLRIVIRDNGIGFNPEIFHFTSGFGLFRLKEKTELLGGKFGISSRRGKGTRVVIIFPCKNKEKK